MTVQYSLYFTILLEMHLVSHGWCHHRKWVDMY